MPFFDDSGPRPEEEHNPVWRSLALVRDQPERMVALNIGWAVQSVPLLVSWALPQLPLWLRVGLSFYTAAAMIVATAVLFAILHETSSGVPLEWDLVKTAVTANVLPAFSKLLPLFSLFYWLALASAWLAGRQLLLPDALVRLAMLLLGVVALYWGPLSAAEPALTSVGIFKQSVRLFWQSPGATLQVGAACLAALVLGIISIAGFFLIIPALIALMQIQLYRSVHVSSAK